ncbi:uncharacterized protein LOC143284893 [Babylonia areolata]|uniref:uncharacterized protein LOC143284893 n=1 Tax=Babylonia areolata TaxID=304850 RepID=UPI003FD58B4A
MVRIAGQTPTMDNREEILDALNDFSRKQPKEIPPLLEQFLKQVAKTGETLFPWTLLKALFVAKLEQVMHEFNEECINDEMPTCPNVENAHFEVYRARIMEAVHRFHGAPFTIQRLCELLTDPKRHYKRCDKFMRGLEKNVLVVSTVDPFGRKVVSESKNLVNGMDSNNSSSEEGGASATSSGHTAATPPVPSWSSPSSSSSSPTTSWPVQADLITPSTSPLLEVCDLPDPKESLSGASTTTPHTSSDPSPVNGHDMVASSSMDVAADGSAVTGTPSAHVPLVSSLEETVDSSDQHVAAEEMVGVEEEAALSTAISQEAAGVVEETVVETLPVAAEGMKETPTEGVTEGSAEVTSPASGDWLANITDKTAKSEPSTAETQDDTEAQSQTSSSAESREASGAESPVASVPESPNSGCSESQEGVESRTSASEEVASVAVADSSDAKPSTEDSCADTCVQPDSDSAQDQVSSGEGETEAQVKDAQIEECDSATKVEGGEESGTAASDADDSKEAQSVDTVPTASKSDPVITNTSPTTSDTSGAEDPVPPVSAVPTSDSAEANTAEDSSEVSTSQEKSPSACTAAAPDAESTNPKASDADVVNSTATTSSSASPVALSASSEEERSEEADTNSAVDMETDSAEGSDSVPKAAESTEPEATTTSSGSGDVQQEAPSTDSSSQPEPMEQD